MSQETSTPEAQGAGATGSALPPTENQPDSAVERSFSGITVAVLAIALCLFQMYTAGVEPLGLFYQRPIHLFFILAMTFIAVPLAGRGRRRTVPEWLLDGLFIVGAVITGLYLPLYLDDIVTRVGFWTTTDTWVSGIAVLTLLEACRRVVGNGITVVAVCFLLYAMAGPRGELPWLGAIVPDVVSHRGFEFNRVATQLFLTQEGIFGLPLGVAATYVFIFVMFGAVLEVTGAGRFFIDLAYALTGSRRGGPAKASVVASMAMGSITGASIANVVTTGPFTIPLMKRLGYKPSQAAGVEAAASTGGQITPPLMGAGAFLIAEYTGVPYIDIAMISIFPAFLYFLTTFLFVHIVAVKLGLKGLPASQLPGVRETMAGGWHYLAPLGLLIWMLILGLSPVRVGYYAILSIIATSVLRFAWNWIRADADGRMGITQMLGEAARMLVSICDAAGRNALAVSLACAVGGVIVGVIGMTGLGLKFSSVMLSFSGGNILLALLLVLLASLVLGFGLPVTASYIVLIILVGPTLSTEFGIPLLIAHLVVFWYSQDSNVTPPLAMAAIAASAIAKCSPLEASVQSWKFAKGLYIIPLFMVFNPEFIIGGPVEIVLWAGALALVGCVAMVAVLEGYLFAPINAVLRVILGIASVFCISEWVAVEAVGFAVILAIFAWNVLQSRTEVLDSARA